MEYVEHAAPTPEPISISRCRELLGEGAESMTDQLFFQDGIAFDGNRFVRTGVTAPAFSYLREIRAENEGLVDPIFTSRNPLTSWMRQIESSRRAA